MKLKEKILNNLTFGLYSYLRNTREYEKLSIICHRHEMEIIKNLNILSALDIEKYREMSKLFSIDYRSEHAYYLSDPYNIDILKRKKYFMETEFLEIDYFKQIETLRNRENSLNEILN